MVRHRAHLRFIFYALSELASIFDAGWPDSRIETSAVGPFERPWKSGVHRTSRGRFRLFPQYATASPSLWRFWSPGAYRSLQNGLSSPLKSRAAWLLGPVWRIQALCGCLQSGLAF
jgi:hypothetical protein